MKRYLTAVNFELTRRCNMNCEFCAKGEAQNKDITTEVIDKALDELSKFEVHTIRAGGGEPMLNKTGLIYLIDEIIRRDIKICNFLVFTNGTVRDRDIKEALVRIGEHCKKCTFTDWGKDMLLWIYNDYEPVYDIDSYVELIVSTNFHNNSDLINDTIAFYNDGVDPEIMCAANQTDSFIEKDKTLNIILEGNADKNLLKLHQQGHKGFSLYNNKYSLIKKENDKYLTVEKTLSVCVNGNVTAGCTQSYEHADSDNICNIFDCNGNFYDYIDKYSWDNPLSKQQAAFLTSYETPLYLHERGIDFFKDDADRTSFKNLVKQVQMYAELIKEVHKKYNTLTHTEAQEFASLILASDCEKGDVDVKKYILEKFYGDSTLTDEDIETGIQLLVLEHQSRVAERLNLVGNTLLKNLIKFGV